MIRIQRSRLPAPSVLVDRKERGDTERRKAESYYKDQNGNAHKKAFPFKIYFVIRLASPSGPISARPTKAAVDVLTPSMGCTPLETSCT
jgi:hypothetical protein